jgi:NAD+ diphosphatase
MKPPLREDFPAPRVGPERRLDRMAEKRADRDWVAERLSDPSSRFVLIAGLKLAVDSEGKEGPASIRWLSPADVVKVGASTADAMLLGCDADGHAVFGVHLTDGDLARRPGGGEDLKPLVDLRSLAQQGALEPEDLSLAGLARALTAWHESHRCCGRCGGHTRNRAAGWRRQCWACGQNAFPRMDPAVIVLVTDGERCLLGHHRRYAHSFYSVLAGFVEPGEDIEDCVRREIFEEAGVQIGTVTYLASQPWPFPHSLMVGCWAEALTTDLRLEEEELVDARWFTRDEVKAMMDQRHPNGFTVPGSHSIAHSLIKSFAEGTG